ncbi:MAG: response regulator, partial [Mediterranea sp.]|nr:response regulator [Mediterranea sp.]
KKIDYRIEVPESAYLMWIDEHKIASAIQTLLSNAFKYTPNHGCIMLQVESIEIDQHKECKITVSDTGQGISAEYQQHIFESFITTPNVPTLSSTVGIGLHIVKHTVELHHGNITLQSQQGEGSTFTLYIPEGKEHFCQDPNVHVQEPACQPHDNQTKPLFEQSILVIEDNKEVRTYICSLFQNEYHMIEASDGAEGVQLAVEKQPMLIISDIMMPVKDGITCCKEIKESPRTAHIPVLMLTAKGEDDDMLQAINSGADDYMIKPFNPQILVSKVHHLIQQRNRLKRIYTQTLMLNQHKQEMEEKQQSEENDFLQSVIQVIEANLADDKFNVKMLAEQLNMSQPTLYRRLKQVSKLNAIDMIRGVRMSQAASLLLEQRYSIQEITERVGYSDIRTLRKHFTEQFGISPSKFLEEHEEKR